MEPRLSLVTLGRGDIARSRAFYEALGFEAARPSEDAVTFFSAGGVILALFGRAALAEDAMIPDSKPGFSGIALAHDARSEADVDAVLAEAAAAGATLIKSARKAFWGDSGYLRRSRPAKVSDRAARQGHRRIGE